MTLFRTAAATIAALLSTVSQASAQTIDERLTTASIEAGEGVFRKCKACHTAEKDAPNRVGPNLYGIVGQEKGAAEGFRYSPAIATAGGAWSPQELDAYLENPRRAIPGTRMAFPGLRDPEDRADVIAYLRTMSDTPADENAADLRPSDGSSGEDGAEDFGLLVDGAGAEETYDACTACHSEMIVVQQGKTRDGWDKLLDWMIEEQGMAELPPDERDAILDYLAQHYNTDRPNFPQR
ncbi:cytochrome c family protein [Defluviimonas sp. WL0002]|uniref:Cytochrome c family protein n=1 Tax=Albidovulum marisflavi TaxID=2984159 RepID=A0ABT2ZER5_9RHOB|nr:cytochrome c family protein [Defluviimonas sp. WL0002]MCV2869607.1 cytochrome c family protein [Defluviimonas sp. WL0002]